MTNYQVLDWMTPNPVTITPKTTLPEAHRLMKERKIRRLPVLEDGRLVGVVTLGDIREAEPSAATSLSVWELNYLLDTLTIDKIMRRNVLTVSPRTSIRDAAAMMLAHKVSGLPVVDHDRLVGVITESDIFRMLVREMLPETAKS
jgi:CBS domain-containing protein